jgi:hypothetical protein
MNARMIVAVDEAMAHLARKPMPDSKSHRLNDLGDTAL